MAGGLGESIRKGVGMVHGTGEAIRGNVNAAVDQASGDKASAIKNKEIANKGADEFDHGYRGHGLGTQPATGVGHNVAPTDTYPHGSTTTAHPTSSTYGSTTAGPHGSNLANKVDPRVDSDMDHRANPTSVAGIQGAGAGGVGGHGSTNVGPHASNVGNKLDPRFDSDADHRANPTSGVGPSAGAGAGASNVGPHSSNLLNKLDPRVDSDADHRAIRE